MGSNALRVMLFLEGLMHSWSGSAQPLVQAPWHCASESQVPTNTQGPRRARDAKSSSVGEYLASVETLALIESVIFLVFVLLS